VRQDDFESLTPGAFENPGTVIAVFVSHKDGGKVAQIEAQARQARNQLARAEAAVEQYPGASRLDHHRVAAATAAKRSKAQTLHATITHVTAPTQCL